jgi:hypothetical protein
MIRAGGQWKNIALGLGLAVLTLHSFNDRNQQGPNKGGDLGKRRTTQINSTKINIYLLLSCRNFFQTTDAGVRLNFP